MTRYALVPVEATEAMAHAGSINCSAWEDQMPAAYAAMLAASPARGAVTAAQLEAAAEGAYLRVSYDGKPAWGEVSETVRRGYRADARAAFEAIGLTVQP